VCAVLKNGRRLEKAAEYIRAMPSMSIPLPLLAALGQKKRGSASRAKSTPKEEGGGDKLKPDRLLKTQPNFRFALGLILHKPNQTIKEKLCNAA